MFEHEDIPSPVVPNAEHLDDIQTRTHVAISTFRDNVIDWCKQINCSIENKIYEVNNFSEMIIEVESKTPNDNFRMVKTFITTQYESAGWVVKSITVAGDNKFQVKMYPRRSEPEDNNPYVTEPMWYGLFNWLKIKKIKDK